MTHAASSLVARLRNRPAIAVGILFAISQLPLFDRTLVSLDEGQLLAIGHRLASGEVLYRDIYTGIFPGVYWLAEALFRIFGSDVIVLRWAELAVNSVTAALLFAIARTIAPGLSAWLVPVGFWVLVVLSHPALTMLGYSSLSLMCGLGAMVLLRRYVEDARTRDGTLAGVLLGLSVLFKQNFGVIALVSALVSVLWTRREGELASQGFWRAAAPTLLAGAAVAFVAVARLVWTGAWDSFLEATFITIFESQASAFNQPFPPVFGSHPADGLFLFLYGPGAMFGPMLHGDPFVGSRAVSWAVRIGYGSAFVALALAPLLAIRRASAENPADARVASRFVLPFSVLLFLGIFPSAVWSHLAAVYPPLLIVLAWGAFAASSILRRASPAAAVFARRVMVAGIVVLVAWTARLELVTMDAYAEPMMLPAASVRVSRREAKLYRAAADFLGVCASAGEKVFVAPDMPLLYVTTGRPNPTPYDLVIPGDVRESVILERMKSAGVSCVVFNPTMYVQFSSFAELFPNLARWLDTDFETVGNVKSQGAEWRFLRRHDVGDGEARS